MHSSGVAGLMVLLFLMSKGTSILFSIVAVLVCIPTNSLGKLSFLYNLLQHLLFADFFS